MIPRRVLLTGASGLVGIWMRRLAPDEAEMVCVKHHSEVSGADTVIGDLRGRADARAIVDAVSPDLIVHLAYRLDRSAIVDMTANLVATDVPLLYASTDAVFRGDGRFRSEMDEPDPVWDYGRWKVDAERITLDAGGVVVRLPLMCSVDPDDRTTATIRRAASGDGSPRWYQDEVRMPAWASDVAAGLWRIALAEHSGGIWHLMGPEALTRAEIAEAMARELGVETPGRVVPSPPAESRPRSLLLSDDRARAEIRWNPTRLTGR